VSGDVARNGSYGQMPVEVEIARAVGDLKLPEGAVGEFEPLMNR